MLVDLLKSFFVKLEMGFKPRYHVFIDEVVADHMEEVKCIECYTRKGAEAKAKMLTEYFAMMSGNVHMWQIWLNGVPIDDGGCCLETVVVVKHF